MHSRHGFTLVELLIVIVVIAILAAISIVAYNGVQNRANDTTVQSDLTSMAKKLQLDQVDRGHYVKGGSVSTTPNSAAIPGFRFAPSKSAYWTENGVNLFYCEGQQGGNPVFRVVARSKSGTAFRYDSQSGMASLGNTALNNTIACQGLDSGYSWGYGYNSNPIYGWFPWANG